MLTANDCDSIIIIMEEKYMKPLNVKMVTSQRVGIPSVYRRRDLMYSRASIVARRVLAHDSGAQRIETKDNTMLRGDAMASEPFLRTFAKLTELA